MAYDAEARHKKYLATKKKEAESDERNIQNRMRYNQNHDQQDKVDANNERNIHKQMLYDSNHDREIVKEDKDEANIRKTMRTRDAFDNNKYYKEGQNVRKMANRIVKKTGEAIDAAAKSISKKGPDYQQTNPTASGDGRKGGQMDREWKNHKWVSRERNQNGKWMYDYGGGTSGGHKPTITNKMGKEVTRGRKPAAKYQERNEFDKAMTKARDAARNTGANLNRAFKDLGSAASDVVSSGANFLNNLFK